MIAYELPPIDFGWDFLLTVDETAAKLQRAEDVIGVTTLEYGTRELAADWTHAKDLATEAGWDGDFRHPPVVFWVPCDTEFRPGFVFKQDDNGTTYVVSPTPLPHLVG